MKKALSFVWVCMSLLLWAGCKPVAEVPVEVVEITDQTQLDALTETYLGLLINHTQMWNDRSWYGLEDMNPDYMVQICADENWLDLPRDWEGVYEAWKQPAEAVEAAILEHFDVSVDYLRGSRRYDPDTHTYELLAGGGGAYATVLSARWEGDLLLFDVGVALSGNFVDDAYFMERLLARGTLTVDLSVPEAPQYVSYEIGYRYRSDLYNLYSATTLYIGELGIDSPIWTDQSWQSPMEIKPDYLIYACAYHNLPGPTWEVFPDGEEPTRPADEMEAAVLDCFAVTAEYLRGATCYNANTHLYRIPQYDEPHVRAIWAEIEGDVFTVEVGLTPYDDFMVFAERGDERATAYGLLTLDISDDPYRPTYLAYERYE